MTIPKIIDATYLTDYKIEVAFADGVCGVVNLENVLHGELREPLRDLALFQQFHINEELETIIWAATGAEFPPEFYYHRVLGNPINKNRRRYRIADN